MPFCIAVAEKYGWTLHDVKRLTVRQLLAYVNPKEGVKTFRTYEEYLEWQTQQR